MVELSLVLPILMVVLLVSLDLGRAYFAYVGVLAAAENGVRVAADPGKTDTDIRDAVTSEADGSLTIPDPTNNVDILPETMRASGGEVTVTVTYPFQIITPFVVGFFDALDPDILDGDDKLDIVVSARGVVM